MRIEKIIVLILMVGLVSAGVLSFSNTLTLSRERKEIADDWNLTQLDVTKTNLGGGRVEVCFQGKKVPFSCNKLNATDADDWVKQKVDYFIDKEINYRNEVEPAREIWEIK